MSDKLPTDPAHALREVAQRLASGNAFDAYALAAKCRRAADETERLISGLEEVAIRAGAEWQARAESAERERDALRAELKTMADAVMTVPHIIDAVSIVAHLSKSIRDGESLVGWTKRMLAYQAESDALTQAAQKLDQELADERAAQFTTAKRLGEVEGEANALRTSVALVRSLEAMWRNQIDQGMDIMHRREVCNELRAAIAPAQEAAKVEARPYRGRYTLPHEQTGKDGAR